MLLLLLLLLLLLMLMMMMLLACLQSPTTYLEPSMLFRASAPQLSSWGREMSLVSDSQAATCVFDVFPVGSMLSNCSPLYSAMLGVSCVRIRLNCRRLFTKTTAAAPCQQLIKYLVHARSLLVACVRHRHTPFVYLLYPILPLESERTCCSSSRARSGRCALLTYVPLPKSQVLVVAVYSLLLIVFIVSPLSSRPSTATVTKIRLYLFACLLSLSLSLSYAHVWYATFCCSLALLDGWR